MQRALHSAWPILKSKVTSCHCRLLLTERAHGARENNTRQLTGSLSKCLPLSVFITYTLILCLVALKFPLLEEDHISPPYGCQVWPCDLLWRMERGQEKQHPPSWEEAPGSSPTLLFSCDYEEKSLPSFPLWVFMAP